MDIRWYTLGSTILIFPVSIIRWMKFLVPFSAVANILLVGSLVMIFWEIFRDLPPISTQPAVVSAIHWPIYIATVFLSLEGVGTVSNPKLSSDYHRNILMMKSITDNAGGK